MWSEGAKLECVRNTNAQFVFPYMFLMEYAILTWNLGNPVSRLYVFHQKVYSVILPFHYGGSLYTVPPKCFIHPQWVEAILQVSLIRQYFSIEAAHE